MEHGDFLRRINKWAIAHNALPLTPRQLRDLVDEGIVEGPTRQPQLGRRTPKWDWDRRSYRQVLHALRLRSQGAKSFAEIRSVVWIRSTCEFSDRFRTDILKSYKLVRSEAIRASGTDAGPVTGKEAALARNATMARRLGQPSPLLRPPAFEFPSPLIVGTYDEMRFGAEGDDANSLARVLVESLGLPDGLVNELLKDLGSTPQDAFAGIIGDPGEVQNSAERTIVETDVRSFVLARALMQGHFRKMRIASCVISAVSNGKFDAWAKPFENAAIALKAPRWQIAQFVTWLQWAHNATPKELAEFTRLNAAVDQIATVDGGELANALKSFAQTSSSKRPI